LRGAVLSKFRWVDQRIGRDATSAFSSCGHAAALALGSNGSRLCENSARYNRTRNFEAWKLLPQDQELYVLAQSHARIDKERAMRRRKLKWLWARLKEIAAMDLERYVRP
jgi:hypothetical protein